MSKVLFCIPTEDALVANVEPADTHKLVSTKLVPAVVPIVLPLREGTATLTEYLAQLVVRVTAPNAVFTVAEGEPPDPKFCDN